MADETDVVTGEPQVDPETGVHLLNDIPINHRLRAEYFVGKGETTDLEGVISDELIADTKARLAAEKRSAHKPAAPAAPVIKES